jgi:hypothetical protein
MASSGGSPGEKHPHNWPFDEVLLPDQLNEKALAACAMLTALALLARALVDLAKTLIGS